MYIPNLLNTLFPSQLSFPFHRYVSCSDTRLQRSAVHKSGGFLRLTQPSKAWQSVAARHVMSTPTSYHLPHSVHLMLDNPPLHRSQPRNTSIAASPPQKPSGSHTVSTTQIQQLTCPIRPQPTDSYRRSACEPAASSGQDLSFSNVTQFSVFRVLQGSFRSIHESRREGTRSLGKEKSISDYYGCRKNNAISAFLHEPAAGLGVGSCERSLLSEPLSFISGREWAVR